MHMNPDDIERAKIAALDAVTTAGPSGIRGADLGKHLRGFEIKADYGGVRAFLEAELPEVREVGRSGLDPIFALSDASADPGPDDSDPELWRVWISPGAPLLLLVDPRSGAVRTGTSESASEFEVAVPSPDVQAHRRIAREFLDQFGGSLRAEQRSELESAVQSETRDWWREWRRALGGGTLVARWSEFRSEHFMTLLREALRDAGVSGAAVETATSAVAATRGLAPASKRALGRTPSTEEATGGRLRGAGPQGAEESGPEIALLVATIASLSPADRARVWVPFSAVVEALKKQGWTAPRE